MDLIIAARRKGMCSRRVKQYHFVVGFAPIVVAFVLEPLEAARPKVRPTWFAE